MSTTHSSILVSLGSLVSFSLILCLSGCGKSDRGSAAKLTPVTKDLSWCSEHGDLDGVKAFLTPAKINGTDDQTPPLHLAAKGGQRHVAEFLISRGADINMTDSSLMGWTPLQYAASAGQANMIEYLVQMGAKMDVVAKNGDYPIHTAARYGHIDAMKKLMDAGALPEQASGDQWGDRQRNSFDSSTRSLLNASSKYQPIHAAAQNNQPNVVKFLILGGTPPDAKDAHGNNVLHYATSRTGWTPSRAETIRLVDQNGEFEKAAASTISTDGYYVTDESPPRFIRFMPEELVNDGSSPYLTQRAVISFGPRGSTKPGEVAEWLYPNNQEAAKQGGFISGTYKVMKGYVNISTFDSTYQGGSITLSKNNEAKELRLSMRTMQAEMFPGSGGASAPDVACKFVSWK